MKPDEFWILNNADHPPLRFQMLLSGPTSKSRLAVPTNMMEEPSLYRPAAG
jgi:hypothetical protein